MNVVLYLLEADMVAVQKREHVLRKVRVRSRRYHNRDARDLDQF